MINFLSHWNRLSRRKQQHNQFLICFDFDGTLSPLASKPHKAVFPIAVKKELKRLSRRPGIRVAILSGRSLADVKRKVGLSGLIYSGNHGFEILAGGRRFIHPVARRERPTLAACARDLRRCIKTLPGAILEDKIYSLSLHYRLVEKRAERARLGLAVNRLVGPYVKSGRMVVRRGKMVYEIRPRVNWDKGKAIQYLYERSRPRLFLITVGDDLTDEDGFRFVAPRGWAIRVGRKKGSLAPYCVNNQSDIGRLIRKFLQLGA